MQWLGEILQEHLLCVVHCQSAGCTLYDVFIRNRGAALYRIFGDQIAGWLLPPRSSGKEERAIFSGPFRLYRFQTSRPSIASACSARAGQAYSSSNIFKTLYAMHVVNHSTWNKSSRGIYRYPYDIAVYPNNCTLQWNQVFVGLDVEMGIQDPLLGHIWTTLVEKESSWWMGGWMIHWVGYSGILWDDWFLEKFPKNCLVFL